MAGLLYKDFVSVNRVGRVKLIWLIAVCTLLFIALRIAFPGTSYIQDFMVTDSDGNVINIVDAFFLTAYGFFLIMSVTLVSTGKIMSCDGKDKIKVYLDSMPLRKNTYVASKYVFIGISAYVFMSLDYIWGVACTAFCREGRLQELAVTLNSFVFCFISIMILIAAIELPLYISLGKEMAVRAMIVFWTVIALIVIGYLMFGDLTAASGWDILAFTDFVGKHKTGITIFQALEPLFVIGLYYVSYLISCYLYNRKGE